MRFALIALALLACPVPGWATCNVVSSPVAPYWRYDCAPNGYAENAQQTLDELRARDQQRATEQRLDALESQARQGDYEQRLRDIEREYRY